jgi:hypothetical protein
MRCIIALCCPAELLAGQQLRVKAANARSVQLEWDGAAGPVTVERTNGSTFQKIPVFQKIAAAAQANYEDSSIDPFATCRYGVSAGGKSDRRRHSECRGPQPATLHVIEADNDKTYVLWQEPGENKFTRGMLL